MQSGQSGQLYQKLVAGATFNIATVLNDQTNTMIERMNIECNTAGGGGAITIQLPSFSYLQGFLNFEICITDTGNNASVNNINIVPAGSNTINQNSSRAITTNKGGVFIIGGTQNDWAAFFNANVSSGGGSGTVTSFSAGNLSPLFTSNVATSTTTPALTFSLSNQNANLLFAGPATGVATVPTFRALVAADMPSVGAGSGTVTNFSAGDLSPLFTTSEATTTTTPALTFSLTVHEANLVFAGPSAGAPAAPTFRALAQADFYKTATATLDFPSTPGNESTELTIALAGAVVGNPVILGIPAAPDANACFTAYVSAANVVTIRFNNYGTTTKDPASGSYTVSVLNI